VAFRIRLKSPNMVDRFIAYHETGAIMLVADPSEAELWATRYGAKPTFDRCSRTCVEPNEITIQETTNTWRAKPPRFRPFPNP
jgi:hypothetical protein